MRITRAEASADCRQHWLNSKEKVRARVNRDRAVKDGARRSRAFHGARQPSGERNLRGFSRGCQQQKQADDQAWLPASNGRRLLNIAVPAQWCMANYTYQQSDVD